MLALAWRIGGFLKEESKGRFLVNAWLRIMSGHGANPIFFNKENKDWTSITLTNPPRPTYPPPHPTPIPSPYSKWTSYVYHPYQSFIVFVKHLS